MRILGLIALYAVALFLTSWLLLDVESMLVSELTANKELDIPENVLLDALEDMRYWNRFSALFCETWHAATIVVLAYFPIVRLHYETNQYN